MGIAYEHINFKAEQIDTRIPNRTLKHHEPQCWEILKMLRLFGLYFLSVEKKNCIQGSLAIQQ